MLPATTTTTVSMTPSSPQHGPHPQKTSLKPVYSNGSQTNQEPFQKVPRRTSLLLKQPVSEQVYNKKMPSRSSKPIINWFQRKLGGTVRTRRIPDGNGLSVPQKPLPNLKSHLGVSAAPTSRSGRTTSSPWPQSPTSSSQRQGTALHHRRGVPSAASQRRTISLNDAETDQNLSLNSVEDDDLDASTHHSSLARDSMWSPASALEADEDASLRPLPPSSPPSPSLSHSSSSFISHSRTFRSVAASTKPTTVLSIDLQPAGIGHIAQVPVAPISHISPRHALHTRSSSTGTNGGMIGSGGGSITFSALPPSRPPSSLTNLGSPSPGLLGPNVYGLQAPLHTAHHPRNNPRPSSPPPDNASVLTLASSAYAMPVARTTIGSLGSVTLSGLIGGGDSISHLGGSGVLDPEGETTSQDLLAYDDRLDVDGERDVDASLRALRPRSSRRGSWDSEASGWSAKVLGTGAAISTGSRSMWTNNSLKTGGPLSMEDGDDERGVGVADGTEPPSEPEGQGVALVSEANDQRHSQSERTGTPGPEPSEDVPSTLGRSSGAAALLVAQEMEN